MATPFQIADAILSGRPIPTAPTAPTSTPGAIALQDCDWKISRYCASRFYRQPADKQTVCSACRGVGARD